MNSRECGLAAAGHVIEINVLHAVVVGIRVVENPLVAGDIGTVAILLHDAGADGLHLAGSVFKKIESAAVTRLIRPREDVRRVAPDEV